MASRIAAIADVHYHAGEIEPSAKRRTAIADELLLQAVRLINRLIKPDVTILLGDLIDDPSSVGAEEELVRIRGIVDLLESPVIAIPGNHDGDEERFYRIFPRPQGIIDIAGVRFVVFLDREEPGYNARRSEADLRRMDAARAGYTGPIVSIQHVPLFGPGSSPSPYGLTNAEDVWAAFERNRYTLALSGHYHAGDDPVARGVGRSVIVPALCEEPFQFVEVAVSGDDVETRRHEIAPKCAA